MKFPRMPASFPPWQLVIPDTLMTLIMVSDAVLRIQAMSDSASVTVQMELLMMLLIPAVVA